MDLRTENTEMSRDRQQQPHALVDGITNITELQPGVSFMTLEGDEKLSPPAEDHPLNEGPNPQASSSSLTEEMDRLLHRPKANQARSHNHNGPKHTWPMRKLHWLWNRPRPEAGHTEDFRKIWIRKALVAGFYMISWFITSLLLSMYNTYLFSEKLYNFRFPLFTTAIHQMVQFFLSLIAVTWIWPSMRPQEWMGGKEFTKKYVPCGVTTSVDIGLSNVSLKVISLSFYTMVKSGAPVFILLFAFLFKLEKPTWKLTGIILVICFGVLLMVLSETSFNLFGYLIIQTATIMSGLRWALTQVLLTHRPAGENAEVDKRKATNPLAATLFLAPVMCVSLLIATVAVEGIPTIFRSGYFASAGGTFAILGAIIGGGCLAFLMVLSEFFLISHTSVVTLSVGGIVKEIITLVAAAAVFGDKFPPNKIIGLLISIGGIAFYNYMRWKKMRRIHEERRRHYHAVHDENDSAESLNNDEAALLGLQAAAKGIYGFHAVNVVTGAAVSPAVDGADEEPFMSLSDEHLDDIELDSFLDAHEPSSNRDR
ncbi:triose-phosphate transporter family-domain-containing protein [Gaertneriomyces semiglobifer]|nr:triose-phosphate transporter family-domain-containing protein [Gaertneriomyces semiglobifer]